MFPSQNPSLGWRWGELMELLILLVEWHKCVAIFLPTPLQALYRLQIIHSLLKFSVYIFFFLQAYGCAAVQGYRLKLQCKKRILTQLHQDSFLCYHLINAHICQCIFVSCKKQRLKTVKGTKKAMLPILILILEFLQVKPEASRTVHLAEQTCSSLIFSFAY